MLLLLLFLCLFGICWGGGDLSFSCISFEYGLGSFFQFFFFSFFVSFFLLCIFFFILCIFLSFVLFFFFLFCVCFNEIT